MILYICFVKNKKFSTKTCVGIPSSESNAKGDRGPRTKDRGPRTYPPSPLPEHQASNLSCYMYVLGLDVGLSFSASICS